VSGPARQLPLDLPHEASFAREDFLPAPENAEALAMIDSWPRWPSPVMMLIGPRGAGKSHLGAIWARSAHARIVDGERIAETSVVELAAAPALLIEDADRIGECEAAMFHLLNLVRENGVFALLTARQAPDLWGLRTPDLLSRLRLAPTVSLGEPDIELTQAVLFKLFSDRQLTIDPSVVAYIAPRIERSLDAARAIVAELDQEALARGKPVTRAMAAKLLRDSEQD
jgi:chromosomal replication initiation ATPase DnaA